MIYGLSPRTSPSALWQETQRLRNEITTLKNSIAQQVSSGGGMPQELAKKWPLIGNALLLGHVEVDGGTYDYDLRLSNFKFLGLDGKDAQLTGVDTLFLDSKDITLRGTQALKIWTPEAYDFLSGAGRVLALIDPNEGTVEYIGIEQATLTNGIKLQDAMLAAWAGASAYTITSALRDGDGVITTASVAWPDGSAGVFTTTTKNTTFLAVDSYTITHATSGKTVTQAAVTRDVDGLIIAQPAITIS